MYRPIFLNNLNNAEYIWSDHIEIHIDYPHTISSTYEDTEDYDSDRNLYVVDNRAIPQSLLQSVLLGFLLYSIHLFKIYNS